MTANTETCKTCLEKMLLKVKLHETENAMSKMAECLGLITSSCPRFYFEDTWFLSQVGDCAPGCNSDPVGCWVKYFKIKAAEK